MAIHHRKSSLVVLVGFVAPITFNVSYYLVHVIAILGGQESTQ